MQRERLGVERLSPERMPAKEQQVARFHVLDLAQIGLFRRAFDDARARARIQRSDVDARIVASPDDI